jgi:transmembrane sensor
VQNFETEMDDLIGKYVAGEATEQERLRIEDWQNAHEDHRKQILQYKEIYQRTTLANDGYVYDTNKAWLALQAKIKNQELQQKSGEAKVISLAMVWRIAAAILLVVGVGYFFIQQQGSSQPLNSFAIAAEHDIKNEVLPDGTSVVVNKTSSLAYAFEKKTKTHKVVLSGEAFFNIANQPQGESFLVETEGVFVKDIGTSFNVKAYPDADVVEVYVEEGEVLLYTNTDQGISVTAGQRGVYHRSTKTFSHEAYRPNVISYKTKSFSFEEEDLAEVVKTLNEVYQKTIVIDKNLYACKLTVSFEDEDVEEIAAVIAETLSLKLRTTDTTIELLGNGCQIP